MKVHPLGELIQDATRAGVLPANVTLPVQDVRPWPVVLMTALGAWLAALPLVLALGFMLGSFLEKGGGTYIVAIAGAGRGRDADTSARRVAVCRAAGRAVPAGRRRPARLCAVSRHG